MNIMILNIIILNYVLVCRMYLLELLNSCLFHKDRIGLLRQESPKGPMKTPRLLGHKWISIVLTIFAINMCFSNLVVILPKLCPAPSTEKSTPYKATCTIGTKHDCPTYTRDQMVHIGNTVKHDIRYSKIPFETKNLVRKYRIHKWPRKLGPNWPSIKPLKANTANLVSIEIKKEDQTITNNLRIATVNTRSIKNKSELVMETSKLESVDMLAITETWPLTQKRIRHGLKQAD